jgi:membrane protein DedA with SNARE-associated domain
MRDESRATSVSPGRSTVSSCTATLISLLESYGYVVLFLHVPLESLGIPLPGETALVTAAALAAAGNG